MLKPCPFCGGKAKLIADPCLDYDDEPVYEDFYVECKECKFARLPAWGTMAYATERNAINAWNERV